jgi:hypothetical protein
MTSRDWRLLAHNGQRLPLELNGSAANDPQQTFWRIQVHAKGACSGELSGTFAKGFPEVKTTVQCRIALTTRQLCTCAAAASVLLATHKRSPSWPLADVPIALTNVRTQG